VPGNGYGMNWKGSYDPELIELYGTKVVCSSQVSNTRVKGSGRLNDRERSVLRALWEEREAIAREHDIAPNRLLHDDVLRDLATAPPSTAPQLVRRSQRRRPQLRRHAEQFLAAVRRGLEADPEPRGGEGRRWSERERALHDALRARRAGVAEEIGIDAGILCPSRPLWAVIAGRPTDGYELCELAGLRPWQTELLADPLWEVYVATVGPDGDDDVLGESPDDDPDPDDDVDPDDVADSPATA
jgi:ribonuclease D